MKPLRAPEPYEFDPARVIMGEGWFEYQLMAPGLIAVTEFSNPIIHVEGA